VLAAAGQEEINVGSLGRAKIVLKRANGHSYFAVEQAIRLIASGKYPLSELCTHSYGLADVGLAIRTGQWRATVCRAASMCPCSPGARSSFTCQYVLSATSTHQGFCFFPSACYDRARDTLPSCWRVQRGVSQDKDRRERSRAMIKGLGHVGIICDDFMKMRDFYTRVIGLTITDEDPERGSCFLSADPEHEHHELNLGQSRGPDHPDGARPKTQGLGQMSFIVPGMDDLRALYGRFQAEDTRILRSVTHGISVSIYFLDPEDNVGEVYYKTGYNVRQGFSRPIDFEKQSDEEILAFSKSFEATIGPFQGAKLPVGQAH